MRATRAAKRRDQRFGRFAEAASAIALRLRGFRILDRRVRLAGGEIDLVARRGDLVIFVEVKARPTAARAGEALTVGKLRKVESAIRLWLSRRPDLAGASLRLDGMLVTPWRWPRHVEGVAELRITF
jgi:putative endonuclease